MSKTILVIEVNRFDIQTNAVDLENGSILCTASRDLPWKNTGIGKFEADAELIWNHVQDSFRTVLDGCKNHHEIEGILLVSENDSLIPVDEDYKPLRNAILSFDVRAKEEAQELTYLMGEKNFSSITGSSCQPFHTCAKVMWLKRHEASVFHKARYFLNISEYLYCRMGFGVCTDFTQACGKRMFHRSTGQWSSEIASCLDIAPAQAGGSVQAAASVLGKTKQLGNVTLPYEIPVLLGLQFTEAALLGLGASPNHNKIIGNLSGSRELLGGFSRETTLSMALTPTILNGGLTKATCSVTGSCDSQKFITWYADNLCKDTGNLFSKLEEEVRFDASSRVSFLTQENALNFAIADLDVALTTPAIYQSVIESITYHLKEIAESLDKTLGSVSKAVYCGGAVHSRKWLQLKADLLKKEVRQVSNPNPASVGAAVLAAVTLHFYQTYEEAFERMIQFSDVFVPNPAISAAYQERFITYCKECRRYYQYL